MKVWELIAKLSQYPAGADVKIGLYCTNNVPVDESIYVDNNCIALRSHEEPNVIFGEHIDDSPLSKLVDCFEDNFLDGLIKAERVRHGIQ